MAPDCNPLDCDKQGEAPVSQVFATVNGTRQDSL